METTNAYIILQWNRIFVFFHFIIISVWLFRSFIKYFLLVYRFAMFSFFSPFFFWNQQFCKYQLFFFYIFNMPRFSTTFLFCFEWPTWSFLSQKIDQIEISVCIVIYNLFILFKTNSHFTIFCLLFFCSYVFLHTHFFLAMNWNGRLYLELISRLYLNVNLLFDITSFIFYCATFYFITHMKFKKLVKRYAVWFKFVVQKNNLQKHQNETVENMKKK